LVCLNESVLRTQDIHWNATSRIVHGFYAWALIE